MPLKTQLGTLKPSQRALKASLEAMIARGSRPGGPTGMAGWGAAKPSRGRQRRQLKKVCGAKCFLRPEDNGYPVCQKCHNAQCDCTIDCRGLKAARMYAVRYKAANIQQAAEDLMARLDCR